MQSVKPQVKKYINAEQKFPEKNRFFKKTKKIFHSFRLTIVLQEKNQDADYLVRLLSKDYLVNQDY